ncbi:MAG: peptidoglycan DD-metalloendopeptidase family protein [Desulfitobacteriaceae bacterium]
MNKFEITKIPSDLFQKISLKIVKIKHLSKNTLSWISHRLSLINWHSRKVLCTAFALLIVGTSTGIYLNTTTSAAVMFINGRQIGVVSSSAHGKQLIEAILQKQGQMIGKIAQTHDQIEYQGIRLAKANLIAESLSENEISSKLTTYIDGVELDISGTKIAILPSQEDVQSTLKAFQDYITKPSDSNKVDSVSFVEEVTTKHIETQPEQVQLASKVLDMLNKGKPASKDYIVKDTDSWWLIARNNNMKTKDVLAGNLGATENTFLHAGQKIKIVSYTPYLTVVSKGILTQSETIPFDVQYIIDNSLSEEESIVKQQGSEGSKLVTTEYTQKDGKFENKQVIDQHITKQPIPKIVAKSPIQKPYSIAYAASRGTGEISGLAWSCYGNINSPYGYRSRGFHSGIDIAGSVGDPFTASASGTVVEAGWSGAYGKMILINHGNGIMTRYGHASKILVSAGQHVSQGQTIALVGATGDATGPHLHFEVIINGNTVNPLNYLH